MFLIEQIQRIASQEPGKLAAVHNGRPVPYPLFWRMIERSRRDLQASAAGHGIAILLVRDMLDAWILSLAARSLGLHASLVANRDQAVSFEGLDVACLVTLNDERMAGVAAPTGAAALALDSPSRQPDLEGGPLPPLPDDLAAGAQILLTSGTTGASKKVQLPYGATRDLIDDRVAEYHALGDGFRRLDASAVINIMSMGLWTGGGFIWPTMVWGQGGAVVMYDAPDVQRAFDWPGLTHTLATPGHLAWLMALPEGSFPHLPDMQLAVVSGGLSPALTHQIQRRLTRRILVNLSSTEGGGFARSVIETEEDLRWYKLHPGRVIEVVDDAGVPLPPGELGRLRVNVRPRLATGYLGDPQTSATFFSDGWFYPGDLAVLDGEGRIALYGRTTDIVHIKGDKYPAEPWEGAIQEQLQCDGVCILSGSWRSEEEQLHLFIESRRPITPQALAAALQTTLHGFAGVHVHMVPSLPRTPNGKLRRIELARQLHEGVFGPNA
ncbi:MAG TPA: AMP-binding protein [Caulobacteraceae bacterium]|nr:AMP-binding protein [Caulobacteraceae bacterium]